ncbi:MAG: FAD:protein FMN transferase [Solirubrobacteraceae bacterium]|nr:FAD:protein FMN transferase [Solirubrobacteraceae bacterium]
MAGRERSLVLNRFGGRAELRVQPAPGCTAQAQQRLDRAAAVLAQVDQTLSRFDPASELSQLNADPRDHVPATPLMLRFAEAVGWAARRSGGLVDATCLAHVERAGYRHHFVPTGTASAALPAVFAGLPVSHLEAELFDLAADDPADDAPMLACAWRNVVAGPEHVNRPAGVRLDSGGIGKGLAADLAADLLRGAPAWMVDCGGDLRIGGTARMPRAVDVRDPVDPSQLIHRLHITRGAVATSGVTRRSWDRGGARSHHLIDPRTGRPADTGVLQVTALAPTALEAEVIAKTALLHGAAHAHRQLPHGGVVVAEHGCVTVVPPPRIEQARRPRPDRATFQVPGRAPVTRAFRSR